MPTARDYNNVVEKIWEENSTREQRLNVHPNLAMNYVRAFYKQVMGRKFPYKLRIGSGNRRTWRDSKGFTVNPEQGWHDINHDMSHFLERMITGKAHSDSHLRLERDGAALICRRFLRDEPYEPPKAKVRDLVAERAARIETRIKKWETKQKRATTALKKLYKQRRYYEQKLTDRAS
ncbi:MAG: hypothetical protein AMJ72_05355 [Acidithiobacillales bacterium SM1_46]|nr:MAG: hypothetical protein AMJ72_05355 [Acidithiobacillales bacterium SM1_46]